MGIGISFAVGNFMLKSDYDPDGNSKIAAAQLELVAGDLAVHENNKVVSDTVRHADDTIASVTSASYTKRSTITFTNGIKGTLRVKVDIYTSVGGTASAIFTKNGATPNGSNIGVVQEEVQTSWQTHSQDIAFDFSAGDTIDLWLKNTAGPTTYARNFRIYYDNACEVASTGGD
jgi:hypothetical protein